jgi:hypothetical protein
MFLGLSLIFFNSCKEDRFSLYKEFVDNPKVLKYYNDDFLIPQSDSFGIKSIDYYQYQKYSERVRKDSIKLDSFTLYHYAKCNFNLNGTLVQYIGYYDYDSKRCTNYYYNGRLLIGESIDSTYTIYYYNTKYDLIKSVRFDNYRKEIQEFVLRDIIYKKNEINFISNVYQSDTLLTYSDFKKINFSKNRFNVLEYRNQIESPSYNRKDSDSYYYKIFNHQLQLDSIRNFDGFDKLYYSYFKNGKIRSQFSKKDTLIYNEYGDLIYHNWYRKYTYIYDNRNNWIIRRYYNEKGLYEIIKREITYCDNNNNQDIGNKLSDEIIKKADYLCSFIPIYAKHKQDSIDNVKKDITNGNYGKSIIVLHGAKINDFIPKHWSFVCSDTGNLFPYKSKVIIAAFNTSIPATEPYEFLRCLAIFEVIEGKLCLREQYNFALDGYNENQPEAKGYSVKISNNMIQAYYQYMRGESNVDYEYDISAKDWRLVSDYSSHRTCCVASSSEYDFKNGKIHISESGMGDYNYKDYDTTIYLKQLKNKKIFLKEKDYNDIHSDTIRIKKYGLIYY